MLAITTHILPSASRSAFGVGVGSPNIIILVTYIFSGEREELVMTLQIRLCKKTQDFPTHK